MKNLPCMAKLAGMALAAALLVAGTQAQQTRAEAEKDPVLKAMLTEMDRSTSHLQLAGFAKPYFIQYRVVDLDEFTARATFGASTGAGRAHQRVAVVNVRVGDRKVDSSNGRGDSAVELAALDNDEIALRSALWSATDQAYKAALATYAQKQAALKQVQTPPQADDFSEEKPIVSLDHPAHLELGKSAWEQRMEHASGIYRTAENDLLAGGVVEYTSAEFHARATTTWIVTSEGTIVRKGATAYEENFAASTQASDGMSLNRSYASTGVSLADLDAEAVFEKHARGLLASLGALRQAPLVEDEYHGPVLLSSDASADALHSLLAPGLAAVRPKLGTEARTVGAFASSYHARVLPEFIDVVDDPGLTSYNGKGLIGAYAVDDEGLAAEAVKVIEAGKLENYLIGRQPVRDFPHSNGHGRASAGSAARPSIGVLKATAREGLSDEELDKKLIEIAKDRGLDHVYFVETLGGIHSPRLLYRVATDGKRTLVRGSALGDMDQRTLRSGIEAAGKDLFVANYFEDVPVTVLAPSLLVGDATLRRANEKNEKLPFYPAP
jgi:predicted Zn-dependent protease